VPGRGHQAGHIPFRQLFPEQRRLDEIDRWQQWLRWVLSQ